MLPWQVVVASMLRVKMTRSQAHPTLWRLLAVCDTPFQFNSNLGNRLEFEIKRVLRPYGLVNERYNDLWGMSQDWTNGHRPPNLFGCDRYVTDSYRIFVLDDYRCSPQDSELGAYCLWRILRRRRRRDRWCG